MSIIISGIQQLGVGVADRNKAWEWYRKYFGMDVPVFQEAADAPLMTQYTGNKVQGRDAVLALNLKGGSGFEIWQYTSRQTGFPAEPLKIGDLGILAGKIKSPDVRKTFSFYKNERLDLPGDILKDPAGKEHFFVRDPFGNIFDIVQAHKDDFYGKPGLTGGPCGACVGVSDIDRVLPLYREALGFPVIACDQTGCFEDLAVLPGGEGTFRRVLLTHKNPRKGAFAEMFGYSSIELIQSLDRTPRKVFEGRYWGDAGFIHLCFDIHNMDGLGEKLNAMGYPFTVDSQNSFDMGEAAGRFTYIEDPDGTLIEFVETHKIPIMKKWGWYLNLQKRDPEKALPRWMLKMLGLGRVKD